MNDWLDFFASIIGSLAWPLATVTLVVLLRGEIVQLLGRLRWFRYRDLELEFGEQVQNIREEAEQADLPRAEIPDQDLRLAVTSPRALVLESWLRIEQALASYARQAGIEVTGHESPTRLMRELDRRQQLDPHVRAIIADLRGLRNAAAHEPDFALPPERALEYANLAAMVYTSLSGRTPGDCP